MVRIAALLVSQLVCSVPLIIEGKADAHCLDALKAADVDNDERIDTSEFPVFVALYRPDVVSEMDTLFSSLPLPLQSAFNTLACDCQNYGGSDDCCVGDEAHLPASSKDASSTQLLQVCSLTDTAIDSISTLSPRPTPFPMVDQPTVSPAPTAAWKSWTVQVSYTILVADGKRKSVEYTDDLVQSMDRLGEDLRTANANLETRRRSLVSWLLPPPSIYRQSAFPLDTTINTTSMSTIILVDDTKGFSTTPVVNSEGIYEGEGPCPADLGVPTTDICAEITHDVPVQLRALQEGDSFESTLQEAINRGALQTWLEQVAPNSPVTVLSGQSTSLGEPTNGVDIYVPDNSMEDTDEDDALTGGAKFGIVIVLFGLLGVVGLFLFKLRSVRRDSSGKEEDTDDFLPTDSALDHATIPKTPDRPIAPLKVASPDESESGWSSSQGHSSRGTAEEDDLSSMASMSSSRQIDLYRTHMMDLQEMSATSSERRDEMQSDGGSSSTPMEDLERAIMVGDWSAVGASATILMSTTGADSSTATSIASAQEEGKSRGSGGSAWQMAVDARKAAELDKLIEAGNWEGVISAAAKYESEADESSVLSASDDGHDATTLTTADYPKSVAETIQTNTTSGTENPARSQIAALLQRVVPQELENLDDMLEQFQGREDDLIETLMAMEQRHGASMSNPS